ncbi:trypsin-like peptidase domain-containing protein [bacterium]|nr:trypsin-like peptidase domain-containing protein [bacterium]
MSEKRDIIVAWRLVCAFCILMVIPALACKGTHSSRQTAAEPEKTIDAVLTGLADDQVQETITQSRTNAITRAVKDVSPAVVGINVKQIRRVRSRSYFSDPMWDYFFPREYLEEVPSLGSGFIISSDGYILTNQHVIDEATEIMVTTTDGKQYKAEIAGQDAKYDIALLKIDVDNMPYIPLGDSEDIIIGEWVIALGNPFGLFDINSKPTVTVGVVSATGLDFRNVVFEGKSYVDMIQTDAAINAGNSGGPLVNSSGYCIGINTFIFSGDNYSKGSIGLGFAIPVNRVKGILPELKRAGHIDRSFSTGLRVENVPYRTARMLNVVGVIVTGVDKNSPAERAGIQENDIIVEIDGRRIRSTSDAREAVNQFDVREQTVLPVAVYRKGAVHTYDLQVK